MIKKTLFLLCFCRLALSAQDVHFSQFHHAPLSLNPALVGAFDEDQRFGATYRNQWFSVPVPYETFFGAYSQKVFQPWLGDNWLGLGGAFAYDQAGDAALSWLQLALHGAFNWRAADEHILSAGLQLRFGQRALEPGQFNFADQFSDNVFDPGTPTAESFSSTASGFFSLGAGINWFYQPEGTRSRAWAGLGAVHLNQPTLSFFNDGSVGLPVLFNLHTLGFLELTERWDLAFNLLGQRQGTYQEIIGMAGGRFHLSQEKGRELALQLGIGYRLSDAVVGYLDVYYKNWRLGLSYDVNTSPFTAATNRNGGPELSVQYVISHVKPPAEFKACPIF
ncbi:MAG: PorP/SprF family type IX secretion system membrane protein [Phaeodactylibacter sp.]|nr:PorP/SprF family type IX secretion system membrane protein [Phaeodactylibacter sp.]MCB9050694.1 PorP/SprF family type IX secretion system membrane protein [Lewinellaceae bacterium]